MTSLLPVPIVSPYLQCHWPSSYSRGMVKRQIARLRGGHRFFFGGAGGAPTRPARLNGDAVI